MRDSAGDRMSVIARAGLLCLQGPGYERVAFLPKLEFDFKVYVQPKLLLFFFLLVA